MKNQRKKKKEIMFFVFVITFLLINIVNAQFQPEDLFQFPSSGGFPFDIPILTGSNVKFDDHLQFEVRPERITFLGVGATGSRDGAGIMSAEIQGAMIAFVTSDVFHSQLNIEKIDEGIKNFNKMVNTELETLNDEDTARKNFESKKEEIKKILGTLYYNDPQNLNELGDRLKKLQGIAKTSGPITISAADPRCVDCYTKINVGVGRSKQYTSIAIIPKNTEIREVGRNNKKLVLFSKFTQDGDTPIEIFGAESLVLGGNTELTVEKINGKKVYSIKGIAHFRTSNSFMGKHYRVNNLEDIRDATIKVEDSNIIFADFISTREARYEFEYKGKAYSFDVKEGGRVLFDPEGNQITGENAEINYQIGEDGMKNYKRFQIAGKFSLKLDENGKPTEIIITNGIYKPDSLFGELSQEFFSIDKNPLHVFLNGRDVKDFDGNAISIKANERIINIKGLVKGNRLKKTVNYEGKTTNAYTIFHYDGKKDESGNKDGFAYFDVVEGTATVDNGKHLAHIKNGRVSLRVKNGAEQNPTDFRLTTHDSGKEVIKAELFLHEKSDLFYLVAYDPTGKQKGKPAEISLLELEKRLSPSLSDLAIRRTNEENLQLGLGEIQNKIDSGKFSGKDLQSLELQRIILQNKVDLIEGKSISAISNIESFLSGDISPEIRAIAQNTLGELRLDELAQVRASYDSSLAQIKSEKARRLFQKTIDYAEKQLKSPDLDQKTKESLILMGDQAKLNLGRTFLNTNREIAIDNFEKLKSAENPQIRSEANRLIALSMLAQNPVEHIQSALQSLKQAVKEDPNNQIAAQTLRTLKLNLINARQSQFFDENQRYLEDIIGMAGEGSIIYGQGVDKTSFFKGIQEVFSPVSKIYYQFSGRLDEHLAEMDVGLGGMEVRRLGSHGMEKLEENYVNMENYLNSDFTSKFKSVMESHGYDRYISAKDFENYAKGLRLTFSEERSYQDLRILHGAISRDPTKGETIADSFVADFAKITASMGAIEHAVKNDPMLHLIAGNGREIGYEGAQSLEGAFTTTRAGKPLERTWTEAISLETGDFVVSAIATAGTAGFLAKGAAYGGRAIGLGAKTARAVSIAGKILSPGQTLALKLLGQTAPKTAIALGFVGEVGIGFTAPFFLPTEAAAAYDIASIMVPGGGIKRKISKIADEVGNTRLFLHTINEKEVADIGDNLIKQGARKRTDLGSNIFEFGDEIIEVGRNFDSKKFKVVSGQDINALNEYNVFSTLDEGSGLQKGFADGTSYEDAYKSLRKADTTIEKFSSKNVDSNGRILSKSGEILEEGRYLWTVDNKGNFRLASVEDSAGKRNIHAVLAEGRPVHGAGEVFIDSNGKITQVTTQSGHYFPGSETNPNTGKILKEEFDEQGKNVFELLARKNGINLDETSLNRRIFEGPSADGQTIRTAQQNIGEDPLTRAFPYRDVFTRDEFMKFHEGSGGYHDQFHSSQVARISDSLSRKRGLSPDQIDFNRKVGVLHDIQRGKKPGVAPNVDVTLKQLRQDFEGTHNLITGEPGKSHLKTKLGWGEREVLMAEAMIQRTDPRFDPNFPDAFSITSPEVKNYRRILAKLNPTDRAYAMKEGYILSEIADKGGYYLTGDFKRASRIGQGLVDEINTGIGKNVMNLRNLDSPTFLRSLTGPDSSIIDRQIAKDLGIDFSPLTLTEAFDQGILNPRLKRNFNEIINGFDEYNRVIDVGGSNHQALLFGDAASKGRINLLSREALVSDPGISASNVEAFHGTNKLVLEHWRNFGIPEKTYFGIREGIEDVDLTDIIFGSVQRNTGVTARSSRQLTYLESINRKLKDDLLRTGRYTEAQLDNLARQGVAIKINVPQLHFDSGRFVGGKYTAEGLGLKLPKNPLNYEVISQKRAVGAIQYLDVGKGPGSNRMTKEFIQGGESSGQLRIRLSR